jgi:hypothetical protein
MGRRGVVGAGATGAGRNVQAGGHVRRAIQTVRLTVMEAHCASDWKLGCASQSPPTGNHCPFPCAVRVRSARLGWAAGAAGATDVSVSSDRKCVCVTLCTGAPVLNREATRRRGRDGASLERSSTDPRPKSPPAKKRQRTRGEVPTHQSTSRAQKNEERASICLASVLDHDRPIESTQAQSQPRVLARA